MTLISTHMNIEPEIYYTFSLQTQTPLCGSPISEGRDIILELFRHTQTETPRYESSYWLGNITAMFSGANKMFDVPNTYCFMLY